MMKGSLDINNNKIFQIISRPGKVIIMWFLSSILNRASWIFLQRPREKNVRKWLEPRI